MVGVSVSSTLYLQDIKISGTGVLLTERSHQRDWKLADKPLEQERQERKDDGASHP